MMSRLKELLLESDQKAQESFIQIPGIFYAGKSPEQFTAMQQVYREAYAKALKETLQTQTVLNWGGGHLTENFFKRLD